MSAERKTQSVVENAIEEELEPFTLKQQVAERLAEHRNRKGRTGSEPAERIGAGAPVRERTSRIAATVAERYAKSQSYRAFLAEEAERAIRQAQAAAEVAALNAHAVAQAQYDLLDQLDQYAAEPSARPTLVPEGLEDVSALSAAPPVSGIAATQLDFQPAPTFSSASLTVRLAEELRRAEAHGANRSLMREMIAPVTEADPTEAFSLDEEIAFRHDPIFESLEPPVAIPGNLIEFPRQLVASRRARPRRAEGPLLEESEGAHDAHQMRIFEVEAEQMTLDPAIDASSPEWSSILLDAQPRGMGSVTVHGAVHAAFEAYDYSPNRPVEYATAGDRPAQYLEHTEETSHLYAAPFQVAPLSQRVMAAAVDLCAVLAACMIFVAGVVLIADRFVPGGLHLPLPQAAMAAAVTVTLLGFAYQYLFFLFADATPGMRYARVGLCTFADDNPTRSAMRRRVAALALAVAPFGLGLLWALMDEDRLGWHDRISRMYQRAY